MSEEAAAHEGHESQLPLDGTGAADTNSGEQDDSTEKDCCSHVKDVDHADRQMQPEGQELEDIHEIAVGAAGEVAGLTDLYGLHSQSGEGMEVSAPCKPEPDDDSGDG